MFSDLVNVESIYMKILVLGYFGYVTNQIDGQTIKTRDIYSLLRMNCVTEDINFFDTQSFKKSKSNIFKMLYLIAISDIVFYLPAQNNLKYLFPVIFIFSKIFRSYLHYLVVGGWLGEFLYNKPVHKYMLKNISGIYVETKNLLNDLEKYNFHNISQLHNFRIKGLNSNNVFKEKNKDKLKLVFMARVHPMKGVDWIIELSNKIEELNYQNVYIHMYGPILKEYESVFFSKINNMNLQYMGVLDPADIYRKLAEYDLMLFPTKYYTEGFPGTILDSYMCGVPVVATNWLNATEFVENGKTGYITQFNCKDEFINKVLFLIENPENIDQLKSGAKNKSREYSAEKAWDLLRKIIYLN